MKLLYRYQADRLVQWFLIINDFQLLLILNLQ